MRQNLKMKRDGLAVPYYIYIFFSSIAFRKVFFNSLDL